MDLQKNNTFCDTAKQRESETEVDMLSSINPSLVHVNGGAELAIYGDFPGENLTWPGYPKNKEHIIQGDMNH